MVEMIPEDMLDTACAEVASYSDDQAQAEMKRLSKVQPALLAYVIANMEDGGPAAQELAIFMLVVIHRTFEEKFGKRLQKVGRGLVEEQSDSNEQAMEKHSSSDDGSLPEIPIGTNPTQPAVLDFIRDCILEPDHEIPLSQSDQKTLVLTMKTLVDVLNMSIREDPSKN